MILFIALIWITATALSVAYAYHIGFSNGWHASKNVSYRRGENHPTSRVKPPVYKAHYK